MNNTFSKEESKYIFTELFNRNKNVYMERDDNSHDMLNIGFDELNLVLPTTFFVQANNLPTGKYIIHIDDLKYVSLNTINLNKQGIKSYTKKAELIFFIKHKSSITLLSPTKTMASKIVYELRIQEIENTRVNQLTPTYTNLGEEYNQTSFIDTINECMEYGITLNIDKSKSLDDFYVMYLRRMKLMQNKKELADKKLALEIEEKELEKEENDLLNR